MKKRELHIYHTNDIHSHFGNWPQIERFFIESKERHLADGDACFLFDIGDHVDRSHPFTEGTSGKGNVALLNRAGYDAVTIGNNEGITLSKNALGTLYAGAAFDVIVANLREVDGTLPKWADLYKIYEARSGLRIGVIGATAVYTAFYSQLGWRIEEPLGLLVELAEELRERTDFVVCLSHLGMHEDRKLAGLTDAIDLILGGHTHHLFPEGEWANGTLLAATGKFGDYAGHVTAEFDESGARTSLQAAVLPAAELPREEGDTETAAELMRRGKEALKDRVFYSTEALPNELFGNSGLSTFFGEALIAYTEADCALFNAGIFLGGLQEGWVTKGDLHSILPHPINPCVVTLTGAQLKEVYELSLNPEWPPSEIKGLGFRGTIMGSLIWEQLEMVDGQLVIRGEAADDSKLYRLVTLDMFTFGFFFPQLQEAPKEYIMPELIRDVAAWYGKARLAGN